MVIVIVRSLPFFFICCLTLSVCRCMMILVFLFFVVHGTLVS